MPSFKSIGKALLIALVIGALALTIVSTAFVSPYLTATVVLILITALLAYAIEMDSRF